ncbi:hypothetical protein JW897_10125 [Chromobacterium alkanivorans]|uniref:hypothetical protein n=1 Tax=Chromobacterium alkanivorans TaxID=1071719 RepID=UPI0019678AAA|nr:hypothetical protein [Chromobacterium alkanivorans]MBN3004088.1 hypothetical protein [Chromobacterium alkanivorans]
MNGLLEFVFENVPPLKVAPCVLSLIGHERNVKNVIRDGDEPLAISDVVDAGFWRRLASQEEDVAILLNMEEVEIGTRLIRGATLQVIHYGNLNDLVVFLSSEDCRKGGMVRSEDMYEWAKSVADLFEVANFFGGLEPANDEQTQLFLASGVGLIQGI